VSDIRTAFHAIKRHGDEAPTRKGRNTKARILEAGRSVLEQRGYFDTSVSEIAERSGVAVGTFYRYFENKDILCLRLLETLVTELYESVSGSWTKEDVRENLRNSSLRYLTAYYANRKLISAMLQMSGTVPACASLWWALRKQTYDRMKRYLKSSKMARQIDPDLMVTALGSMVEQFAYYSYVEAERTRKPVPKIEDAADVLSHIWYSAVYQSPTSKTEKQKS
jgi:AcrR family transcriptional regulator